MDSVTTDQPLSVSQVHFHRLDLEGLDGVLVFRIILLALGLALVLPRPSVEVGLVYWDWL